MDRLEKEYKDALALFSSSMVALSENKDSHSLRVQVRTSLWNLRNATDALVKEWQGEGMSFG